MNQEPTDYGSDGHRLFAFLQERIGHPVERYGVDVQKILRPANVGTTLAYYTFPNPDKAKAGLDKLTETVRKTYKIKV